MKGISVTTKPRTDGRYEAKYPYRDKRKSTYARTPEEAYKKAFMLATGQIQPRKRKQQIISKPNYKLSDWLNHWHETYRIGKRAIKTLIEEKKHIAKISEKLGNYELKELNGDIIQQYLNNVEKTSGNRTMTLRANIISLSLQKAYKLDLIKKNPYEAVEIIKKKSKERIPLTREEQKNFLKTIEHHKWKLAFYMELFCGLRPGEVIGLKKNDFNFEDKSVYIQRDITETGDIQNPKANSFRTIPVNDLILNLIKELPDSDDFIFKITVNGLYQAFKKIYKTIGIKKTAQYTLRHTFDTRCHEAKIPSKIIQKWMGHASLKMTVNTYNHALEEYENIYRPNLQNAFNQNDDKNDDKNSNN